MVNKDLYTVSGSTWDILHGVTDVEQLKPLGVTTAWNESKSMQPSRCAEESGHRDTRDTSGTHWWLASTRTPQSGRQLLDPPGAALPGGPTDAWLQQHGLRT